MRAHQLNEESEIINTIEVTSLDFLPGLVDARLGGSIGYSYDNGQFSPPVAIQELSIVAPQIISMRCARLALFNVGLLDSVNNLISSMQGEEGERARIEWNYSSVIARDWPLVLSLALSLGLSVDQIDNLFIAASKL